MNEITPKVSVALTTYNHEPYIEQAIVSVVSQRTNFDFEVVVGEDQSTDRTRDTVLRLRSRYPGLIRLLSHEVNVGPWRNFMNTFLACRGRFVALLDGDDYWTSVEKLQRQVDALDKHPDWSMCFHRSNMTWEDSKQADCLTPEFDHRREFCLDDFLRRHLAEASSIMVRREILRAFPPWYETAFNADFIFCLLHAREGKVGYLPEIMSSYRKHQDGIYTSTDANQVILRRIQTFNLAKSLVNSRDIRVLQKQIRADWRRLAKKAFRDHRPFHCGRYFANAYRTQFQLILQRFFGVGRTIARI